MSSVFYHLDLIQEVLNQSPFGLITDVDGTISPTAPTPQQANISPLCHRYLSKLSHQLALVAAVSGRAASEVNRMINIDGMIYIGNHGLERWSEDQADFHKDVREYDKVIEIALRELAPLLSIEGIIIENKGVTATIHYRLCRNPELAEAQILKVVAASSQVGNLKIIRDRMAIDLLPPLETNKGTATRDLIREYHLRAAIYLGDALTDIDAFKAIHNASHDTEFKGFAIGITSTEMPAELLAEADFTLDGVGDVEIFLRWMSRHSLQSG
ncbi:trehalose-phosphatase [Chloroflexota bacterium]